MTGHHSGGFDSLPCYSSKKQSLEVFQMAVKREMSEIQMQQEVSDFKQVLDAQPKRKVKLHLAYDQLVRLQSLEKAGKPTNWPYHSVTLNGYSYHLLLGKECEVPESIYEVLQEAHLV